MNESGIVGKDFLKLLKSKDFRSLVVRRAVVKGEIEQTLEVLIEPYVDGVRQDGYRMEFPGRVRGSIYSRDGHAATVKPEGQEVVGVAVLASYDVRDFIDLIRVGDRLTFEFQGANNSTLLNEAGLNHNQLFLVIERPTPKTGGYKRVCRILVDDIVEKADTPWESVRYGYLYPGVRYSINA